MNGPIIIVDLDQNQAADLCAVLERQHYRVVRSDSLQDLEGLIRIHSSPVVILDLDTVVVDNRRLRDLKRTHPHLQVLALSARRFHPELKEAFTSHIYACLCKPVDPDDLIYLVKSIFCIAANSKESPEET